MIVDQLKSTVKKIAPTLANSTLQPMWQKARRGLNRAIFRICYSGIPVLEPQIIEQGQFNQPLLIDYLLLQKVGGVFLDVGANHPELNSNSLFFEKHRDYVGLAFDPLAKYKAMWESVRPRTQFFETALGQKAGEVMFFEHPNDDGWADQLSYTANSRHQSGVGQARLVSVQRLDEITALPAEIDFASVDVEGAETEIIAGFGKTVRPKIMIVENCFGLAGNHALREQVVSMGYKLVARISYIDDVFVRSDQVDILNRSRLAPMISQLSNFFQF
jgi:FkbM family methyltransferase